jgi:hypothetical protein
MGAHASFTLGMFGANGGMGLEMGTPANQSVFVGYRTHSGRTALLPFFESLTNDAERFSQDDPASRSASGAVVFDESHIDRSYAWASDVFFGSWCGDVDSYAFLLPFRIRRPRIVMRCSGLAVRQLI